MVRSPTNDFPMIELWELLAQKYLCLTKSIYGLCRLTEHTKQSHTINHTSICH